MDLGIKGRKAIVCASWRGLGKACATAPAREGCSVVINGLDPERLERAATEIREAAGAKVTPMRADIKHTEAGRAALIAACSRRRYPRKQQRWPPPGRFDDVKRADWQAAIDANMLAPIFMIHTRHARPQVRAHRERHLGDGDEPALAHGALDLLPHGTHRAVQGDRARRGRGQRHHQQPATGAHRHRPPVAHGRAHNARRRLVPGTGVKTDRPRRRYDEESHASPPR